MIFFTRHVEAYTSGEDPDYSTRGGKYYCSDPKCLKGTQKADEAKEMDRKDRLGTFLVMLLSSEEESSDEEMQQEPMKFDSKLIQANPIFCF